MPRPRVLIVDDDKRICSLIERVAEGLDFEAFPIDNPAVFESAYCGFEPDIVFLDLQMASTDGIELLRALAGHGATSSIILASGLDKRVIDSTRELGRSLGLTMDEPLRKPFEVTDIKARLAKHVRLDQDEDTAHRVDGDRIASALEAGEFALCYQPMVDIATREVTGVEALMRWNDPEHGMVMPRRFIPVAEEHGVIRKLTLWALVRAVRDHVSWSDVAPDLDLSVNLSPLLLDDLNLPDHIEQILKRYKFPPGRLVLEVTEDRQVKKLTNAMDVLTRLRLKGLRLSLDDFGTGYSSLDNLYRLPYGEMKIDKTFVTDAARDRNAAMIVRLALELARNVGLRTVAEGVEDAEVMAWLEEIGCDVAQGVHIAPPLEASRLRTWLESWDRKRVLASVATG